jgi:hypothetical protein
MYLGYLVRTLEYWLSLHRVVLFIPLHPVHQGARMALTACLSKVAMLIEVPYRSKFVVDRTMRWHVFVQH